MTDGGKLAVVDERRRPLVTLSEVYYLRVGSGVISVMADTAEEAQVFADRINAAVEAEVERRLDEITKGVGA